MNREILLDVLFYKYACSRCKEASTSGFRRKSEYLQYLCHKSYRFMPVAKINPAPAMTVGHYRSAAIRHMKTCQALWSWLESDNRPREISDTELLENIFYLTGYVIECAIKYKLLTDVHSLNDGHTEAYWKTLTPKVEIRRHFSFIISDNDRNKRWSENAIQTLNRNSCSIPDYLLEIGNVIPASDISVVRVMQESWDPEIRYHYGFNGLPFPPERAHVDSFFKAAKTLLRNLNVT